MHYGPLTLRARTEDQTISTACGVQVVGNAGLAVSKDWDRIRCPYCLRDKPKAFAPRSWNEREDAVLDEPRKRVGRPFK